MLIYVKGSDSYQANSAINLIKQKFFASGASSADLTMVDEESKNINWFDITAPSLFGGKRLIVIKKINLFNADNQKVLAEIIDKIPADINLIIWSETEVKMNSALKEKLNNAKKIIEVEPLAGAKLRGYIKKIASSNKVELTDSDMEYLEDEFAGNLWAIETEIKNGSLDNESRAAKLDDPKLIFSLIYRNDYRGLDKVLKNMAKNNVVAEPIIGILNAAFKKKPIQKKRQVWEGLSDIDFALKTGLIDGSTALVLIGKRLSQDSKKWLEWEEEWQRVA